MEHDPKFIPSHWTSHVRCSHSDLTGAPNTCEPGLAVGPVGVGLTHLGSANLQVTWNDGVVRTMTKT